MIRRQVTHYSFLTELVLCPLILSPDIVPDIVKLGLNRESIRRYEKNITTPNQEIQAKIAKILKTDVSTLTNDNQKEAL
jgi:hypothetical protein